MSSKKTAAWIVFGVVGAAMIVLAALVGFVLYIRANN
jgi:hypothetical protein